MSVSVREPWAQSKWISKSNAAKYIHVTDAEIERLLREGEIPASVSRTNRKGGSAVVYVNVDDLDTYMRQSPYSPKAGNNRVVHRVIEQPPLTDSVADQAFKRIMEREARKAAKAARNHDEAA